MSKLKNLLYKGSVILPIIVNIYKFVKIIIEFNKTSQEVINARNEIVNQVKYLNAYLHDVNSFNESMKE